MSEIRELPFEGKRLLVLGATSNEVPLVRRAQELGAYVITTDYNTDYRKSPAKFASDECWDVSWSDVDELERRCAEAGVDGATAGFSEIRAESLIRLCGRMGFPCYICEEQLAVTRDKSLFKAACRRYGVPTVRDYDGPGSVGSFPVIVKPADRAGSIGVGIAWDEGSLREAYGEALGKSLTGKAVIEDYITGAVEMDAHYAVRGGEVTLLTTDDIIPAARNVEDGRVVQSAWMYPSRHEEAFLERVDGPLRELIRGLGIADGTVFFSGFAADDGQFSFFECGFRLWGEQEFAYDRLKGGPNYLDIYIHHALTGSTGGVSGRGGNPGLKGVALNVYVTEGEIGIISGIEELESEKDCCLRLVDAYAGQRCGADGAILTKAALVGFANEDAAALAGDVERAYSSIRVMDAGGADMVYDRVDPQLVGGWWG